jgi:sugar phosphate isomerase/epimerase
MRKIGIESSAYYRITKNAEEAFCLMKSHGYDCVDHDTFANTKPEILALPEEEFERVITNHRKAAEDAGITIYQIHGPWRYPPQDATPEDRAERMETMKKSLREAALLGCSNMVIHPLMPYGVGGNEEPERFMHINREFFTELLRAAEKEKVVLCIENTPFPDMPLAQAKDVIKFVEEFNSPYMAICLDTGHSSTFGESPAEELRLVGHHLKAMHVHDNNGRNDWHWVPFRGVVDWEEFRIALREVSEEIPLMLETQADRNLPRELLEDDQKRVARIARYLAD